MNKNPNCDGGHCRETTGEVRVYPLGAGGNLILCHACWAHENRYRLSRQRGYWVNDSRAEANWPIVVWECAEVYGCTCDAGGSAGCPVHDEAVQS